jgi:hypothetical protein
VKWKKCKDIHTLYDGDTPVGWALIQCKVCVWVIHTTPGGSVTKKGWEWTLREAKAQALEAYRG